MGVRGDSVPHDVIDNRTETLLDRICRGLPGSQAIESGADYLSLLVDMGAAPPLGRIPGRRNTRCVMRGE